MRGSDGAVGAIEYFAINVIEVAEDGRIAQQASFDLEDADLAFELLHERARETAPVPNAASALLAEQEGAFAGRDWERVRASLSPAFTLDDRRRVATLDFDEQQSIASFRYMFDVPGLQWRRPLIATRGDRLGLAGDELVSMLAKDEIDWELSSLTLVELDAEGRVARHTVFEPDDLLGALTELEARAAQLPTDPLDIPGDEPARHQLADSDGGPALRPSRRRR